MPQCGVRRELLTLSPGRRGPDSPTTNTGRGRGKGHIKMRVVYALQYLQRGKNIMRRRDDGFFLDEFRDTPSNNDCVRVITKRRDDTKFVSFSFCRKNKTTSVYSSTIDNNWFLLNRYLRNIKRTKK